MLIECVPVLVYYSSLFYSLSLHDSLQYTILIRLLFILIHYHYMIHCIDYNCQSLSSLSLLSPLQFISA